MSDSAAEWFAVAFGAWAVLLGCVAIVFNMKFDGLREMIVDMAARQVARDEAAHNERVHLEHRLTDLEGAFRACAYYNHGSDVSSRVGARHQSGGQIIGTQINEGPHEQGQ
jgi:hypothetical protein